MCGQHTVFFAVGLLQHTAVLLESKCHVQLSVMGAMLLLTTGMCIANVDDLCNMACSGWTRRERLATLSRTNAVGNGCSWLFVTHRVVRQDQ
jgi:hypothetical protein